MKFGILQFFSWPDRRVAMPTVYHRALQRIELMDRADYDAVSVMVATPSFSSTWICSYAIGFLLVAISI
jgi:hypothetical protein